jgi:polyisoprenoid-binding protein YceI
MKFLSLFLLILLFNLYTASAQKLSAIDAESKISFVIKNIGLDVNGTLSGLKGQMYFDPKNLAGSGFDMTVDVNTINTGIGNRDNHLKSETFFNVSKYPVIQIKTTRLQFLGNNRYLAKAMLTMKGVSRAIEFNFLADPKPAGYLFTGSFSVNRRDYGIGGSSMVMADNANVSLRVVARNQ